MVSSALAVCFLEAVLQFFNKNLDQKIFNQIFLKIVYCQFTQLIEKQAKHKLGKTTILKRFSPKSLGFLQKHIQMSVQNFKLISSYDLSNIFCSPLKLIFYAKCKCVILNFEASPKLEEQLKKTFLLWLLLNNIKKRQFLVFNNQPLC